jgi:protein-S-isoprenylcysteine O-methyltransferase Ste14
VSEHPNGDQATPALRVYGAGLVTLQFALLGVLAWQAFAGFARGSGPAGALLPMLAGFALGTWTLTANRPGNFNIRPQPREGARLIEHGPYRWIRHPMYSALLLAGLGAAWIASTALGWAALVALAAVLVLKARVEEAAMLRVHAGYAAYRARTRRFVPGLF